MKIIAIEGLDGSGKTSLCSALSEVDWQDLKVVCLTSPATALRELCYEWRGKNPQASALGFLLGTKAMLDQVAEDIDIVIFDRYLLSTLVHHFDVIEGYISEFHEFLLAMGYQAPDLTVYLQCQVSTSVSRIAQRENDRPLIVSLRRQKELYERVPHGIFIDEWFKGGVMQLPNDEENNFLNVVESVRQEVLKLHKKRR